MKEVRSRAWRWATNLIRTNAGKILLIAAISVPIALLTAIAWGLVLHHRVAPFITSSNADFEKTGQLGDSFAPIVGMLNVVAVLLAVCSLWLQMGELALQREELAAQRQELAKSAEAQSRMLELMREQSESMKAQQRLADIQIHQITEQPLKEIEIRLSTQITADANDLISRVARYRAFVLEYAREYARQSQSDTQGSLAHVPGSQARGMFKRIPKEILGPQVEAEESLRPWLKYLRDAGCTEILPTPTEMIMPDGDPSWHVRPALDRVGHALIGAWQRRVNEHLDAARQEMKFLAQIAYSDTDTQSEHRRWEARMIERANALRRDLAQRISPTL